VSDIERNKQTVVEFYQLAFNAKQPEQAVEKYVGQQYVQHNPQAPDGAEAFIDFVKAFAGQFPDLSIQIKRVVGERDIVVTHELIKDLGRGSRHGGRRLLPAARRQDCRALGRSAAVSGDQCQRPPDVLTAGDTLYLPSRLTSG
jgi:predicted SnoaL-like aldol condensation-catalyzing enzyme